MTRVIFVQLRFNSGNVCATRIYFGLCSCNSDLTRVIFVQLGFLYGGQFTFSTQLLTLNHLLYSPTDAAPQFL